MASILPRRARIVLCVCGKQAREAVLALDIPTIPNGFTRWRGHLMESVLPQHLAITLCRCGTLPQTRTGSRNLPCTPGCRPWSQEATQALYIASPGRPMVNISLRQATITPCEYGK